MKLTFGAHLSLGDMKYTCGVIERCCCRAIQIFISNPRSFHPAFSGRASENLGRLVAKYGLEVTVHMPYVVNLASADKSLREKSVEHVISALTSASGIGARYYVVHPGSGPVGNLKKSVDSIVSGTREQNTRFLIENTEGSGSKLMSSECEILDFLGNYGKDEVGVCWDTAHAFGAGVDTSALSKKLVSRIRVVHLNDSKVEFGSKKDRHASFASGMIGEKKIRAAIRLFGAGVTYIIEREGFEDTCRDLEFIAAFGKK